MHEDDASLEDVTPDELLATDAEVTAEYIAESGDITEPAASIYGGEGHGSGNARILVVVQPLADRSAMSFKETVVVLESDIREAMALAAKRLHVEASKYSNQGFEWNLDDIAFDHGARRVITATLRIARGDERFAK